MNQHLPPSNIREIVWCPEANEQYFILRGKREPWIDGDLMDRGTVLVEVAADIEGLCKVIAINLEAGSSRDATNDITSVVINRWAEDGKLLTQKQREFVASMKGEAFANAFRLEDVA